MALFNTPTSTPQAPAQERTQGRAHNQRTLQLTPTQEHELLRTGLLLPHLGAQDLARSKNLYHHITHPSAHLKAYACQYEFREFYYGILHHIHTAEARDNYAHPSIWWRPGTGGIPQLTLGLHGAPAGANILIYPVPVLCPATHRLISIAYRCYNWRIAHAFRGTVSLHAGTGKSPLVALKRYVAAVSKAHSAAGKESLDKLITL